MSVAALKTLPSSSNGFESARVRKQSSVGTTISRKSVSVNARLIPTAPSSAKSVHRRSHYRRHTSARSEGHRRISQARFLSKSSVVGVPLEELVVISDSSHPIENACDETSANDLDQKLAFWRMSARTNQKQIRPMTAPGCQIDCFVSHVWQPCESMDLDAYALQKMDTLHEFGIARAALSDVRPWCLADETDESFQYHNDPKYAWQSYLCWVDKACSLSCADNSLSVMTSEELIHYTQEALIASRTFVAVFTLNYLTRLWCLLELTSFIVKAAPHYRRIELALPDALLSPELWSHVIDSVMTFSLDALRTSSEGDHPILWLELEQLFVSSLGFERFIQATMLALLAHHLLLSCKRQCPAFCASQNCNNDTLQLEPIVEACTKLGLHALAHAISKAKPRSWWNLAYSRAKTNMNKKVVEKETEEKNNKESSNDHEKTQDKRDDPMARLWEAISSKFKKKQDMDVTNYRPKDSDSMQAAQYAMKMITKDAEMHSKHESDTLAAVERKLRESFAVCDQLFAAPKEKAIHFDNDDEYIQAVRHIRLATERSWLDQPAQPPIISRLDSLRSGTIMNSDSTDGESYVQTQIVIGEIPAPPAMLPSLEDEEDSEDVEFSSPELANNTQADSSAHALASMIFGGVPEGFGPFWRGIRGKPLSDDERARARLFHEAWLEYRTIVNKWFDLHICPKLELWRQRGLRIHGVLKETFGTTFFPLHGDVQDAFCNRLTPRARELALAREPPPRGRPKRSWDAPWANATFSRLLLVGQHMNGKLRYPISDKLFSCTLPLEPSSHPLVTVLCFRSSDETDWHRVIVPQSLGPEALSNAMHHIIESLGDRGVARADMDVIVPRLTLNVPGAPHAQVFLGSRIVGVLRHCVDPAQSPGAPSASIGFDGKECVDEFTNYGSKDGDVSALVWDRWNISTNAQHDAYLDHHDALDNASVDSDNDSIDTNVFPSIEHDLGSSAKQFGDSREVLQTCRRLAPLPKRPNTVGAPISASSIDFVEKTLSEMEKLLSQDQSRPCTSDTFTKFGSRICPSGLLPVSAEQLPPKQPPVKMLTKMTKRRYDISNSLRSYKARSMGAARLPKLPRTMTPTHAPRTKKVEDPFTLSRISAKNDSLRKDCRQAAWEWHVQILGGALSKSNQDIWIGAFDDLFMHVDAVIRASTCENWVPVDAIADEHGCSLAALMEAKGHAAPNKLPPLARASPCAVCGNMDVATVSLENSILKYIWSVDACTICLTCSHVERLHSPSADVRATATDGDTVLEACTAVVLPCGSGELVQHLLGRVLRLEHAQVIVAAPVETQEDAPSAARPRLAHIALCKWSAGISAAVGTTKCASTQQSKMRSGQFVGNQNWVPRSLGSTGLDMTYGGEYQLSIEQAIGELDDQRSLPRRADVCPLVLWLELSHILSSEFNADDWTRACLELLGTGRFLLTAAVLLRRNIEKLRYAFGFGHNEPTHQDEPAFWPLALHDVLVAKNEHVNSILGVALQAAGINTESLEHLLAEGARLLEEVSIDDENSAVLAHCISPDGSSAPARSRKSVSFAGIRPQVEDEDEESYRREYERHDSNQKRECSHIKMDASMVMRRLASDRLKNARSQTPDKNKDFRAILRARRQLRLIQVWHFLSDLQDKFCNNADWLALLNEEEREEEYSGGDDGFSTSDDESEREVKADSFDSIEKVVCQQDVAPKSREELTTLKIIGHASEYVHYWEIVEKALNVLNMLVKTCSPFLQLTKHHERTARRGSLRTSRLIEQVVLDYGFVRIATRAIYRHWKRPEIGRHALALIEHLMSSYVSEETQARTIKELSTPPERVLTFILAAGKFSSEGHKDQLKSCVRVLATLAIQDQPLTLPSSRECEASVDVIATLERHSASGEVFKGLLHMISGLVKSYEMCSGFFESGLPKLLREWLSQSAEGQIEALWRKTVEKESQELPVSHTGKGVMMFRKRMSALLAVPSDVQSCEALAWKILVDLMLGAMDCEGFERESNLTIQHCMLEINRVPRTGQWAQAIASLTRLIVSNPSAHAGEFVSTGGVAAILAELPDGDVTEALVCLDAVLGVAGKIPPPPLGPGESDDDDENAQRRKHQTARRSSKLRRSSRHSQSSVTVEANDLIEILTADEDTQAALQKHRDGSDSEEDVPQTMDELARQYIRKNKGVTKLLEVLVRFRNDTSIQQRLCRVLSQMLRDSSHKNKTVALEFENFGNERGGGITEVLVSMQTHLQDSLIVEYVSMVINTLLEVRESLAHHFTFDGVLAMVDACWAHTSNRNLRARCLKCLRLVRKASPGVSTDMCRRFEDRHASFLENSSASEVPRDLARFGALIKVHRYIDLKGLRPLHEVLDPIKDHTKDKEIAFAGIRALTKGTESQLSERHQLIAADQYFAAAASTIVTLYPEADVVMPLLSLLTGVLDTGSENSVGYADACALTIWTALDIIETWTANAWEALLTATEAVLQMQGGKDILIQYEVHECLDDEWQNLNESEEDFAQLIVQAYVEDTKRVLDSLGLT